MGYDSIRFLDTLPNAYFCSVCAGVLQDPVCTECEHLFCKACIHRWLENKQACPLDRQWVSVSTLRPAPCSLRSLLSTLRIKCEFESYGCTAVVRLDELATHEKQCPDNPNYEWPCPECDTLLKKRTSPSDHDCVAALKDKLAQLERETEALVREKTKLAEEVQHFRDHERSASGGLSPSSDLYDFGAKFRSVFGSGYNFSQGQGQHQVVRVRTNRERRENDTRQYTISSLHHSGECPRPEGSPVTRSGFQMPVSGVDSNIERATRPASSAVAVFRSSSGPLVNEPVAPQPSTPTAPQPLPASTSSSNDTPPVDTGPISQPTTSCLPGAVRSRPLDTGLTEPTSNRSSASPPRPGPERRMPRVPRCSAATRSSTASRVPRTSRKREVEMPSDPATPSAKPAATSTGERQHHHGKDHEDRDQSDLF